MDEKKAPSSRIEALESCFRNHKGIDAQTQCHRLAEGLKQLGSITTVEARRYLDILQPAARIFQLRHHEGWKISTLWEHVTTDAGVRHRIARYLLVTTPDRRST